jgi:hypothetical protein
MSRRALFTKSEIANALNGAHAAGLQVGRLEIGGDGRIILHFGEAEPPGDTEANPWDKVLSNGAEKRSA